MKLSERLKLVASMVTPGFPVTDVGTDHGYIPIYLVENKIVPSAVASDINPGPLEHAEKNILENGLEEKIRLILCDGVPKEKLSGTLVVAGMGGMLMSRILKEAGEYLSGYSEFVLSPQSDTESFRADLIELGLQITDEEMISDMGKIYPVIKASYVGIKGDPYKPYKNDRENKERPDRMELIYGPCLLKKKHPVLLQYLEKQIVSYEEVLGKLSASGMDEGHARFRELSKELEIAKAAKDMCLER